MSNDRRIKGLKTRQKSLLASFGLIKAFVDSYDDETGSCEIPVRLESLDALWTDFKQVQSELETLDEATLEQQLKQRTDFESSYYRVKGFLLSKNKAPPTPSVNTSHSSSQLPASSSSHVRLPDVKLPVFSGNLDDWLNFHDLFVSLVHSSVELSNIQKFYYLRSSLADDALKLVQTIPISANSYPVAWNLLVDHYQNTARLKQSYLDALFELPSLKRESAADLHSLVEKFEANVKVLKQLGEKTEYWDIVLIRMLSIRLDPTTRRDWEEHSSTKDIISFKDLTSFIQRRVTVLQTIQEKPSAAPTSTQQFKKPAQRPIASNGASQFYTGRKCVICSDHHPVYMCPSFAKLDMEEKEREVRRHQLCHNCLRIGHHARDCSSSSSCRKCRCRHHTQLCSGDNSVAVNSRTTESSQSQEPSAEPTASTSGEQSKASLSATVREPASYASVGQTRNTVLLATAIVNLIDDDGTTHPARALLDSGSECCFITESLSQLIKAKRTKTSVPISGIGQSSSHVRYKVVSTIRSRISDYSTTAEFLVLPKVTIDLPTASFDVSSWQIPPGVHLADPSFHEARQVDIVIGADIFFELFKVPGRIALGDSLPIMVNSVLGWVISGRVSHGDPSKPIISNVALIADRQQVTENWVTQEDATPSSILEQATWEERSQHTIRFNSNDQHLFRLSVKNNDIYETLDEGKRRLESAPSSNHYLHNPRGANYGSLQTPATDTNCFTGARRSLPTSTVYTSIVLVNTCKKLLELITTKLTASCDTVTEPSSKIVVGLWGLIWILPTDHQAAPPNTSALFFLCCSSHIAHFKLTILLSTINFLLPQHRFTYRREPIRCNLFITAPNESLGLSLGRSYQLAVTRYCINYDTRWQFNPLGTFHLHVRTVACRSTQRYFVRVLGFLIQPQNGVKRRLVRIECCVNFLYIVPITSESLILDHYRLELALKTIPDIDIPEKQNQSKLIWILWHANEFVCSKWCNCPTVIHRRLNAEADVFALVAATHTSSGSWNSTSNLYSRVIVVQKIRHCNRGKHPQTQGIASIPNTDILHNLDKSIRYHPSATDGSSSGYLQRNQYKALLIKGQGKHLSN